MVAGSLLYVAGLMLLVTAHGFIGVLLGAGAAIGASMGCWVAFTSCARSALRGTS